MLGERDLKALGGRVAEQMKISTRHAQRLINIAGLPMGIQKAYSAGRLKLVDADRVSRLDRHIQRQVAGAIEAGGDPAGIVAVHLAAPSRAVRPDVAYERLVAELQRGLDALAGREDAIRRSITDIEGDLRLLERFGVFRRRLEPMLAGRLDEFRRDLEALTQEFDGGGPVDG